MKWLRVLVLGCVALMMVLPVMAEDIPSGSGAYGVKFPGWKLNAYGAVNCMALKFWDADVSIEFIYKGSKVDSVFQARGDGVSYTTPCDSINIIRSATTGGIYLLGSSTGRVCPGFASSDILRGVVDSNGLKISPDLVTTITSLADTLAFSDTLLIDGGEIGDYSRVYVKFLAVAFASDSLEVRFATSATGSWDQGNASFFGATLQLGGLGTYGITHAVTDSNGVFIAGDHLLIQVINKNLVDDPVDELSTWVIKTR